jgi:5-methylcytosine-specific restriction endonuclease McrA
MPCRFCKTDTHSTFTCGKKPRKPLQQKKGLNKIGKVAKKTQKAVNSWKKCQKPNHQGYYVCYLCGRWIDYLMAEHMNSKARRPDQRTDKDNLQPTCADCNKEKGSKNANT